MTDMKATNYFLRDVMPERQYLTLEMCKYVIENHARREIQSNGRIRYWGYIEGFRKYLRVVTLEDGETIHTAFFDRRFKEKN